MQDHYNTYNHCCRYLYALNLGTAHYLILTFFVAEAYSRGFKTPPKGANLNACCSDIGVMKFMLFFLSILVVKNQ